MRVLALTRYTRLGASSRLRFEQFVPGLAAAGIDVTIAPLLPDAFLRRRYAGRAPSLPAVAAAYARRALARADGFDLVWLEKEAFPWIPDLLERALGPATPYVVDLDDAWFHRYDAHRSSLVRGLLGTKLDGVMRRASIVVAGNPYIADHARAAGARRVEILPTVVDTSRYEPSADRDPGPFTIGWIGTPLTAGYLDAIAPAVREVAAGGSVRFRAVGAGALAWDGVDAEALPWSEGDEARAIARFDVGVMPLPDSPWERGKCAYKLLQYMASGRPVVASPVGMNRDLLGDGRAGILADDHASWVRALATLRDDGALRARMGREGRALVASSYDLRFALPRLAGILREGGKR